MLLRITILQCCATADMQPTMSALMIYLAFYCSLVISIVHVICN